MLSAISADEPSVMRKYHSGFSECASEVNHYLSQMDSLDIGIRTRLLDHLANCVQNGVSNLPENMPKPWNTMKTTGDGPSSPIHIAPKNPVIPDENNNVVNIASCQPVQGQIVANATSTSPAIQTNTNNMANIFGGIQVIPTKLPNGQIAFMLPGNVIPVYQSQQAQNDTQPIVLTQTANNMNNDNGQQNVSAINCQTPIVVSPIPSTSSSSESTSPTIITPSVTPISIVTPTAPSNVSSSHSPALAPPSASSSHSPALAPPSVSSSHSPALASPSGSSSHSPALSLPHTITSPDSVHAHTAPQGMSSHSPHSHHSTPPTDNMPQDLSHRNAMQDIQMVHHRYLPHREAHDVEMLDINNINKGTLPDHQDMWRPW